MGLFSKIVFLFVFCIISSCGASSSGSTKVQVPTETEVQALQKIEAAKLGGV